MASAVSLTSLSQRLAYTAAATAAGDQAPAPTARPAITPTPTFVLPFPAPGEDTGRTGDPTLPTRTPTPSAADAAPPLPAPVCNGLPPGTPEGPTYLANTPERATLREAGMAGQALVISGYVLGPDCAPIPGAWLDFWQAGADGFYDMGSFRLRGHQFTDENGRFRLDTIVPGATADRPPHIDVKLQPPGGAVLTTQLFFPDAPGNANDADFRPELLLTMTGDAEARFDFVVAAP